MHYRNKFQQLLSSSIRQSWPLFLGIIFVFGLGIFFGALGVNTLSQENIDRLTAVIDKLLASPPNLTYTEPSTAAQSALAENLITWGVLYFLGLTIIGIPLILVLIFMRGFTLGFTVSFLTKQKPGTGTLLAIASIAPHNLILLPALFISCVASLSFALVLLQRFFNTQIRIFPNFLGYSGVMLITGIAASCAAVIEAYLTPWLTRATLSIFTGNWSLPF